MKAKEQKDFNITERIGIIALLVLLVVLWFRKQKKEANSSTSSSTISTVNSVEGGENINTSEVINTSPASIFNQILQVYRTEMLKKIETINGRCYHYTGGGNTINTRASLPERPVDQELFENRFFVFYNGTLLNPTQYTVGLYLVELTISDSNITVSPEDTITICSF